MKLNNLLAIVYIFLTLSSSILSICKSKYKKSSIKTKRNHFKTKFNAIDFIFSVLETVDLIPKETLESFKNSSNTNTASKSMDKGSSQEEYKCNGEGIHKFYRDNLENTSLSSSRSNCSGNANNPRKRCEEFYKNLPKLIEELESDIRTDDEYIKNMPDPATFWFPVYNDNSAERAQRMIVLKEKTRLKEKLKLRLRIIRNPLMSKNMFCRKQVECIDTTSQSGFINNVKALWKTLKLVYECSGSFPNAVGLSRLLSNNIDLVISPLLNILSGGVVGVGRAFYYFGNALVYFGRGLYYQALVSQTTDRAEHDDYDSKYSSNYGYAVGYAINGVISLITGGAKKKLK
jgi:hypothetical protein